MGKKTEKEKKLAKSGQKPSLVRRQKPSSTGPGSDNVATKSKGNRSPGETMLRDPPENSELRLTDTKSKKPLSKEPKSTLTQGRDPSEIHLTTSKSVKRKSQGNKTPSNPELRLTDTKSKKPRLFRLTERQEALAHILAQYPEEQRHTTEAIKKAMHLVHLSASDQTAEYYQRQSKIFELAQCIANKSPYRVSTQGTSTGLYWTDQLERFCWTIVCDPANDIRKAAKKVGFELRNAKYLYSKPLVQERIAQIREERRQRYAVEAETVLQKLMALATANIADFIEGSGKKGGIKFKPFDTLTPDETYTIQQITQSKSGVGKNTVVNYKIRMEERTKSLALLMRHLGLDNANSNETPMDLGEGLRQWASNLEGYIPKDTEDQ